MAGFPTDYEEVFTYGWNDDPSTEHPSALAVAYEPSETGRRWLLLASHPLLTEVLPLDDVAHVREFAQAMLDMPTSAEPYDRELDYSEPDTRAMASKPPKRTHLAALSVFREATDGLRPGLNYQSYFKFSGALNPLALGLQICCDEVAVDRLYAEARALQAELDNVA
ncbi:hypothetical protein AB0D04_09220 [Streptomyces sp. NPDC048483]|uniref:hypothetical protein n=1 Tax=Streptomyces sp. NPDC048483 TaxID=3154927 RepID=UPI00341B699C